MTLTTRFTIVAVLMLSPLNGLWVFCPPADASASIGRSTSDDCQTVCPVHERKPSCFALRDSLSVVPMGGLALGPTCTTVNSMAPLVVGETITEMSIPLQDLLLSPPSPPPKP